MPEFSYEPRTLNDRSALTDGWHPAFLLAIQDEPTPDTWQMFAQSPRLWRWKFAVWASPDAILHQRPERQSAPSSQKFTPKGRQAASKAYAWTSALLGRQFQPGERVSLDALLPLPCRVKIERSNEYANIRDVEAWTEGAQYLTPDLRAGLAAFLADDASDAQAAAQAPIPQAPQPGIQTWGSSNPQPAPTSTWGR